jgi:flagellin-like protein
MTHTSDPSAAAPNDRESDASRRRVTGQRRLRGQSEVLGVVLLIALTVAATTAIVALGSATLSESREQATIERVEDAVTGFDASSATVALGESPVQSVRFGQTGDGRYRVAEESGWIRVVHHNYTLAGGTEETVYNETLGALVYRRGETAVAYQGGGVWRRTGNGSVMVSPPEFHYRDETLTLPLVLVSGGGQVDGTTGAVVSRDGASAQTYPNASAAYGNGREYANPVQNGMVNVTIHSSFYEAWAAFFRERTDGIVSVNPTNETVTLMLTAGGTQGDFEMPDDGSSIRVRGISGGHAVENFTIVLAPDASDAANFDNMQWAMYVDSGSYELELHIRKSGELAGEPDCADEQFSLSVYFSDNNGYRYHGWKNATFLQGECTDRDGDGTADETQLVVNFTGTMQLSMTDLSRRETLRFNPGRATRAGSYTFDEHAGQVGWEPTTFADDGDSTAPVDHVLNHYFSLLGRNFDLVVNGQNSDPVQEDDSYGRLVYDARGRVTYMHITKNDIDVRLTD